MEASGKWWNKEGTQLVHQEIHVEREGWTELENTGLQGRDKALQAGYLGPEQPRKNWENEDGMFLQHLGKFLADHDVIP